MTGITTFMLPGLGNSSSDHWQSRWRAADRTIGVVAQENWNRPCLDDWLENLRIAVSSSDRPVILVAHSLACSLVAHFARSPLAAKIRAAMLVAPADVESDRHTPCETRAFGPLPLDPLPFPSLTIASSDDPFVDLPRAQFFAKSWQSDFVPIGAAGHINAASGHGNWPEGRAILDTLR